MTNRKTGRPSKASLACSTEVADELVRLAGTGAPDHLLAEAVGVAASTLAGWRRKAEAGDVQLAELFERVERARARGALTLIAQMRKAAADGDWRAASTLLRHLHPRDFSERRQINVALSGDAAKDEALLAVLRECARDA
jgi:transposase-like protein